MPYVKHGAKLRESRGSLQAAAVLCDDAAKITAFGRVLALLHALSMLSISICRRIDILTTGGPWGLSVRA